MAVEISSTLLARLLTEARSSPDEELCGLLFGTADVIATAERCANVAPDPSRFFEIDPAALFAAHRAARNGGPTLIGHYHSHPAGTPVPSAQDARWSLGDDALWLIVTAEEARLWRSAAPGQFVSVALQSTADACARRRAP
ncbi:M67 family metallopeptidase [Sphingomonas sp. RB3P16]|uniref:M67 family metallopeptidase n=1 Tax=Parasphingomonas frigoris TaxID=3096163 RepID=UPI002FC918E2